MKTILSVFIVLIALFSSCCSSYKVTRVTNNFKPENCNGIYYNLPRTVIVVDVTVKKHYNTEGLYASYAEDMLGLKNVIMKSNIEYELGDVKISSYTERDPKQFYFIELGKKRNYSKNKLFINLCESGMIQSVNNIPEINSNQNKNIMLSYTDTLNADKEQFSNIVNTNLNEKIDTVIEKIMTDTSSFEKKVLKKTIEDKSVEQKAKDAAEYIMKVRNDRYALITGYSEVNYEKGSMEFMNRELKKLENEYLKLFTGNSSTISQQYRFTFVPDKYDNLSLQPLFKFSNEKGILPVDSPIGNGVNILVKKQNETQVLENSITERNMNEKSRKGFFYRIPEYANISVKVGKETKTETRIMISQFGQVTNLPEMKSKIHFYPNSGAIKSIEIK